MTGIQVLRSRVCIHSDWDRIRSILEEDGTATPEAARRHLGLDECKVLLTAGVSVPVELLEYFQRLGMTLIEAFGMSENTGGVTINPQQRVKLGSAGRPYPGTYVRIDNPDRHGNGEVIIITWLYIHILMKIY